MTVILCIALVISNILKYGLRSMRVNEGFKSSDETTTLIDSEIEEDNIVKEKEDKVLDKKTDKKVVSKTSEDKDKVKTYQDLKKDFPEFQKIQSQILKGISDLDPLLNKAENFIERFENAKKQ
jgi:hypothetical protein